MKSIQPPTMIMAWKLVVWCIHWRSSAHYLAFDLVNFSLVQQSKFLSLYREKNLARGCTLCCWRCQTIFHKSEIRTEFWSVLWQIRSHCWKVWHWKTRIASYKKTSTTFWWWEWPSQFFITKGVFSSDVLWSLWSPLWWAWQEICDQQIPSILAIEKTLLNAANGFNYEATLEEIKKSCYKHDVNMSDLTRHLQLLQDVVKQSSPEVKKVTSVQTICEVMQRDVLRQMLPTVHLLIRLYLKIPVTSASPERTFSALKRVLTYIRSTMNESRLNNCLLPHVHKNLTDELDLILVTIQFIHS